MAAPKGNEYWKLRSKDGRDKQYPTPSYLLDACNDYFKWVQDNPLFETVVVQKGIPIKHLDGTIETVYTMQVPKMRAMTIHGLCNFIDLSIEGWRKYKARKEYVEVTTRVEQIIYNQKFEGAASGFLNPNIIARDLGLQDKQQTEHTGEITMLTPEQRAKRIDELKGKLNDNR